MTDQPKYVVVQVSSKAFIVGRLPLASEDILYEKIAATDTEAAARQLSQVLGGAKRAATRKQKDLQKRKQLKSYQRKQTPAPRKERQVRLPKTVKP